MATQTIGQDVEAYCGKCKHVTIHTITAMTNADIDKVMCKICMSYHKYKAASGASVAKKAPSKTTRKPAKGSPMKPRRRTKTAKLLEKATVESAISYKMSSTYEAEEAINHKKFGLGIVKDVINNQKITVLFEDGEKILVQNIN